MSKFDAYDIAIYALGLPFDGNTLEKNSLGGSETAVLCMARELANLGHYVTVFCNCPRPGHYRDDGRLLYMDVRQFAEFICQVQVDVLISSRQPDILSGRVQSKIQMLWMHDMGHARNQINFHNARWNMDAVAVLSEYHRKQVLDATELPESLLWKTRNGIDLDLFPKAPVQKVPGRIMYGARPERGLDVMLAEVFPRILEEEPNAELVVCSYDTSAIGVPDALKELYLRCRQMAAALGDRVTLAGSLTKPKLYELMATCQAYVYPTPSPHAPKFREISCISLMEAQACGTPVVASACGALPETLNADAGYLVELKDGKPDADEIAAKTLSLIRDPAEVKRRGKAGKRHAQTLGWDRLARQWTRKIEELFAERNDSPIRRALHFERRSDLLMARRILERDAPESHHTKRLQEVTAFLDSPEAFKAYYDEFAQHQVWPDYEAEVDEMEPVTAETQLIPRLEGMAAKVASIDPDRVLDFGCHDGRFAIALHKRLGCEVVGVDVQDRAIRWCEHHREKAGVDPSMVHFAVKTEDQLHELVNEIATHLGEFDVIVAGEILEHTPEPWAVLRKLERYLRPGGMIVASVPTGPWEFAQGSWKTDRWHCWEFDRMMVRDMVGHRDGFDMVAFQLAQVNRDSGDALGILLFSYCKGSDPDEPGEARKPDLDRKERVLVPRETLSVQMIAGPRAEIQMRWALDSVQHIADEIRIGDTGLNARGLEAAADYGAVVVTVPDPLEEGFDVARNAVLDSTPDWVDWVLWIDSDEHLVGASHLWPLLRPSTWDAFAITQAHFAVEGKIEPDKPARCFRRHSTSTGESFRFFGHIHEHAELGEVNKGPGQHCDMPKIGLAHTGYVSHANRDKRLARNRPMMAKDRERFPTRILHNHLRMRDNMIEAAMEHHVVGHVTPHMRDLALETCQLFREHFLGQPRRQPGTQTLENYTKALSILGEGIECIIDVRAEREGVRGLTNGLTADEPFGCKFLDAKEYAIELAARAKLAAETLTSEHW